MTTSRSSSWRSIAVRFGSFLGGVACALITQHWVSVYIMALQRKTQEPKVIDARRLDAVVRAVQKRKVHVILPAMIPDDVLEAHSDSAFAKEQDKGYGMRGQNLFRRGKSATNQEGDYLYHLLGEGSRSHKLVTRNVLSSEVFGNVGYGRRRNTHGLDTARTQVRTHGRYTGEGDVRDRRRSVHAYRHLQPGHFQLTRHGIPHQLEFPVPEGMVQTHNRPLRQAHVARTFRKKHRTPTWSMQSLQPVRRVLGTARTPGKEPSHGTGYWQRRDREPRRCQ